MFPMQIIYVCKEINVVQFKGIIYYDAYIYINFKGTSVGTEYIY